MEMLIMESDNLDSKLRTTTKITIQFFKGAAFGLFLVLVPFSYFWYFTPGINIVQIVVSVMFVATCGTLSAIWGTKILGGLLKMLESVPF